MGLISSVLLALRVQRNPSVLLLGRQGGRQGRHSHAGAGSSPLERGEKSVTVAEPPGSGHGMRLELRLWMAGL